MYFRSLLLFNPLLHVFICCNANIKITHVCLVKIFNLLIFDLLICGYLLPFSMHILIWNQEPDKRICKFQAIITAFLFSCSILIILLIAFSRYVKICHSQRYDRICSMRNVIAATVFLCLVAASIASPLWFVDDCLSIRSPHVLI
jgi:hypothetical protein